MKTAWLFGGSTKEFGKNLVNGFNTVISFGRHNVDYSDVEGFLLKVKENPSEYPIPDVIIFNISNNGHYIDLNKTFTPKEDITFLMDVIQTTFYFQLRVIEWFFYNFKNKRVLFLTSMECASIVSDNETVDSDIFKNGDLLLYRMTRALEHQVIHTQNVLIKNHNDNNIIMGVCVGHNMMGTAQYLNHLILNDLFKRNIFSIGDYTWNTGQTQFLQLYDADNIFPKLNINKSLL